MKWISVKKALPLPSNWRVHAVLTNEKKLYMTQVAFYSTSLKWFLETDQAKPIKVTHWYPLPAPEIKIKFGRW